MEKIISSKLLKPGANKRIGTVDKHAGVVRSRALGYQSLTNMLMSWLKVYSGLVPDGRYFVSRARDEAASWRSTFKCPIPIASLANRLGGFVQAYTLYSSVRPFGITAIVGGWDSGAELEVDGQVGSGPKIGAGGKVEGTKAGGPGLFMIEPSGLYWVRISCANPFPCMNCWLRMLP